MYISSPIFDGDFNVTLAQTFMLAMVGSNPEKEALLSQILNWIVVHFHMAMEFLGQPGGLPAQSMDWIIVHLQMAMEFLAQPHVFACVMAWWITFTLVLILALSMGFGPAGVIAGTGAAAFQAWCYGGFTPAAGIFATLTSLAMLGLFVPAAAVIGALMATAVSALVWACGVGR